MDKITYRWTSPHVSKDAEMLLSNVIASGQWSYGPIAKQVERQLAAAMHVEQVLLTNAGTSALWILLAHMKKDERQAIILPAYGYSAAANMAANLGYEIYTADTLPDAPVVDPASIKRLMDDKVAAVIGINYFGYSADWDEITDLATSCTVIEDAAGSYGAQYKDRPSGSHGKAAIVSFHTSKAAAAGGEGGCIASNDAHFISRAKAMGRNGHVAGYYYAEHSGLNLLMTDVAACFLRDTIAHFDETTPKRKQIVERMDSILESLNIPAQTFNHSVKGRTQNYQTYAMLVENRDTFLELVRLNGIEARPCWPFLIDEQPATQQAVTKKDGTLVNARKFARHIVNIPVNPALPDGQLDRLKHILTRIAETTPLTIPAKEQNS